MKKLFTMFGTIALLAALCLGAAGTALADSGVIFVDHETEFVFVGSNQYTSTDLFENFKGVLPGDKLRQKIVVENDDPDGKTGKIYLQVVPHDESNPLSPDVAAAGETISSMTEFLAQLHMVVKVEDSVIFEGSPAEAGNLSSGMLLGELSRGQQLVITVELYVPADLGNEYTNRVGEVDWRFTLEESDSPGPGPFPLTGDNLARLIPWLLLLMLLAMAIAHASYRKSRSRAKTGRGRHEGGAARL